MRADNLPGTLPLSFLDHALRLMAAGIVEKRAKGAKPLAIFTGGHTLSGKSNFVALKLVPGVGSAVCVNRDRKQFDRLLAEFIHTGKLFEEYRTDTFEKEYASDPAQAGLHVFGKIVEEFPELQALRDPRMLVINPDVLAHCTRECREAKREEGENFSISAHYYRALRSLPILLKQAKELKLSCVIDSTMGNLDVVRKSIREMQDYNVAGLLFCSLERETAYRRSRKLEFSGAGRANTQADIDASIDKFLRNFPTIQRCFMQGSSKMTPRFLSLLDSSGREKEPVVSYGKMPPDLQKVEILKNFPLLSKAGYHTQTVHDPERFARFKQMKPLSPARQ